jgi:signal transduction histidine kinase
VSRIENQTNVTVLAATGNALQSTNTVPRPPADFLALLNSKGTIVGFNENWSGIVRRSRAYAARIGLGGTYPDVCQHAADSSMDAERAIAGIRSVLDGKCASFLMDCRCSSFLKEGWFRISATRMNYGESRVALVYSDITRVHDENEERNRSLYAINRQLMRVRDEERQKISRELHDDIGQKIALLSFAFQEVARGATGGGKPETIQNIQLWIEELARAVRNLSHSLHPPAIAHYGVRAALESLCRDFQKVYGIQLRLHISRNLSNLPVDVALAVFRITQESLQNIAKHSRANSARVRLEMKDQHLCLTVADSGTGIDPSRIADGLGLGITSMKERVQMLNGHFDIRRLESSGTLVSVSIPMEPFRLPLARPRGSVSCR